MVAVAACSRRTAATGARHGRTRPAGTDRGVQRAHRRVRRYGKASMSPPARCSCSRKPAPRSPASTRRRPRRPKRERRLADLEAGPRRREIDEARATLAGAESALQTDVAEYERVRSLVERKLLERVGARPGPRATRQLRAPRATPRVRSSSCCDRARAPSRSPRHARPSPAHARRSRKCRPSPTATPCGAPRAATVEALPYELGERPAPGRAGRGPAGRRRTVRARLRAGAVARSLSRAGSKVELTVDGERRRYAGTVRYVSAEAAFTPYYALTQKDRSRLAYVAEIDLVEAEAARLPTGLPVQVLVPERALTHGRTHRPAPWPLPRSSHAG